MLLTILWILLIDYWKNRLDLISYAILHKTKFEIYKAKIAKKKTLKCYKRVLENDKLFVSRKTDSTSRLREWTMQVCFTMVANEQDITFH